LARTQHNRDLVETGLDADRVAWTVDMLARLGATLNENIVILVGLDVLMLMTSLSRAYIYQLMEADPTFPPKIKIGSRTCFSFWAAQKWLRDQVARAEAEQACGHKKKRRHL
jgi:predicted DNA-binding transcriptional regulator AlpA